MPEKPGPDDEHYRGFRAAHLWGFFQVDPDTDVEGLITLRGPGGAPLPLIASDRVRLDQYRDYAADVARQLGRPVFLRRFVAEPEPVETYLP